MLVLVLGVGVGCWCWVLVLGVGVCVGVGVGVIDSVGAGVDTSRKMDTARYIRCKIIT
jgi:hypothetical protein